MKIIAAAALALLVIASAPAQAWNDFGHMEVAAVAWSKLKPAARARAIALLKLSPQYDTWIAGVPAGKRDQIAFVRAATWPDAIKRDDAYQSDGPDNGDRPPPGPEASQNIGYADHLRHKYWHFINRPFSPDGTALQNPDTPNVSTQIEALRAKLSEPGASDNVKSYDLVWLLHLVGDVHQPLHAASRFIQSRPQGDAGGNKVGIHCGSGCSAQELHTFWDSVLGGSEDPRAAINAARKLPKASAQLASITDDKAWAAESFKIAKAYAYKSPIGVGDGPFTLSSAYQARALRIAKARVALAGARLARLLNTALR
jgi:hypothetical protein